MDSIFGSLGYLTVLISLTYSQDVATGAASGFPLSDPCPLREILPVGVHTFALLTNGYQNPRDIFSYLSAWLALVPQALCIVYVTLIWSSREVEVILMFVGQLVCEILNFVLKRWIREERPKRGFYNATVMSFFAPVIRPANETNVHRNVW